MATNKDTNNDPAIPKVKIFIHFNYFQPASESLFSNRPLSLLKLVVIYRITTLVFKSCLKSNPILTTNG